jgi:hypothetical protein
MRMGKGEPMRHGREAAQVSTTGTDSAAPGDPRIRTASSFSLPCAHLSSLGDIILYDSHLLLFRTLPDVLLYVVAPAGENELMLSSLLSTLHDAITQLLPHGAIEKRALLENLDLVALAIDEAVDDG